MNASGKWILTASSPPFEAPSPSASPSASPSPSASGSSPSASGSSASSSGSSASNSSSSDSSSFRLLVFLKDKLANLNKNMIQLLIKIKS